MPLADPHRSGAIAAGVVCALVGFTSSFAVVLGGLAAVGADRAEASSGLGALCVAMGLGSAWFSWRRRQPITMAWSTPGAALLGASAAVGGFSVAVGAFVVTGILLALTGLVRPLGELVARIPMPLASAMLAGVVLHLCAAPALLIAADPIHLLPIVLVWVALRRLAPRWAVPGAVVAAIPVVVLTGGGSTRVAAPVIVWTTPELSWHAVVSLAIPLYLVTMTSQNIPGIGVLRSYGYELAARGPVTYTGVATVLAAPFGGHAVNLAAISAALAAGPEAHPDPRRRWVAGVACGLSYVVLGAVAPTLTTMATTGPPGAFAIVAGLALLPVLASSLVAALSDDAWREPAAVAVAVGASGVVVGGVGAAFWALVVGGVLAAAVRWRR